MPRFTKVATPLLLIMSVSPTLADEGASGLYVPGKLRLRRWRHAYPGLYLSSGVVYYHGAIKVYIEGGKIVLMSISDRSPRDSAALWVPETKTWVARSDCRSALPTISRWAHGEVTGLINAEKTVEGWGLGDTIPRAQIGWTSGPWSNTFYLTGRLPTGRYERGFEPNTGK